MEVTIYIYNCPIRNVNHETFFSTSTTLTIKSMESTENGYHNALLVFSLCTVLSSSKEKSFFQKCLFL